MNFNFEFPLKYLPMQAYKTYLEQFGLFREVENIWTMVGLLDSPSVRQRARHFEFHYKEMKNIFLYFTKLSTGVALGLTFYF